MAKRKSAGPKIEAGIKFEIVPANRKALSKIGEAHPGIEFVSFSPQQFAGRAIAQEHLIENADKWSGKYAPFVMIRDTASLKLPKIKDLRERIALEEKALDDFMKKTDAGSFKSKLAACSKCDSRVNRKYIKGSRCPVCGENMRSKTANKTILVKEEKIRSLKARHSDECLKHVQEAPLKYLVAVPAELKGEKK